MTSDFRCDIDPARSARAIAHLRLRLYVAAHSSASRRARSNLRRALDILDPDRLDLEILDVADHPEQARRDGVSITPMLIRLEPRPRWKMGGTFDDARGLLALLSGLA
ncbi:MAG: circadian clock KaiB family protein [Persicimonas sp.]